MSEFDELKRDRTPKSTAPAIHTDELWDLDKLDGGMLQNLGPTPVKATTKTEFRRELKKRGLRMKDQQESDIAPDIVRPSDLIEAAPEKPIEIEPDLNEWQTRTLFAVGRVFQRYGLQEALHCDVCFEQGAPSGCRVTIRGDRGMAIHCHNRVRAHVCMTDMSYTRADAITSLDRTEGSLVGPDGAKLLPTVLIQDDDAKLLHREQEALRALRLNHLLYCVGCRTACELDMSTAQIAMACQCRIRYWQGVTH